MISSTLRSDRRRNSICRKVEARRGASTTPAKLESFDSSEAACDRTRFGSSGTSAPRRCRACSPCSGCTVMSESTKSR